MKKLITLCVLILSLTGCSLYREESKTNTKEQDKNILSSEEALELIKEKLTNGKIIYRNIRNISSNI